MVQSKTSSEQTEQRGKPLAGGGGGSVSCAYLRGLCEFLQGRELDAEAFLARFDVGAGDMEDQSKRIPLQRYEQMLAEAGELAGDADVGLHIGECIKPGQYGVLGYSTMSCKTVAEAFERHMRYENLVSDRAESTYYFEGDRVRLVWDTRGAPVSRQVADENVASWVTYARWITGRDLGPSAIHFTHEQPQDMSEYRRIFNCELHFARPTVEVWFPAEYMAFPIVQHDPVMREMMDAYAERLLGELEQGEGLLNDMRKIVLEQLASGRVTLDTAAPHLCMSPRTLQRRLHEVGETFQSVLDSVRKGLALHYIAQPHVDLAELAYLLGFADQTGFQRAFKKWTGTTPGKYRRDRTQASL